MEICHDHNRLRQGPAGTKPYGIRYSLPEGDSLRAVLGDDWHKFEWFTSEAARDRKLNQLQDQFVYYRKGDRPTFVFEKVNRDSDAPAERDAEGGPDGRA